MYKYHQSLSYMSQYIWVIYSLLKQQTIDAGNYDFFVENVHFILSNFTFFKRLSNTSDGKSSPLKETPLFYLSHIILLLSKSDFTNANSLDVYGIVKTMLKAGVRNT